MNPRLAPSRIETLESRIAPALVLANPLPDIIAGPGKTGATVDLSKMFDATALYANRTLVQFTTNYDADPNTPGIQPGIIEMELYDDLAPLTVQNFLSYVTSKLKDGSYDDTFFHRAVPGFVLQGGGFEASGAHDHVAVQPDVHNEFDPALSNVAGTITMAKTGLGPNTATSEFFFNVADNSSNLDHQNGGFTVFGKVIQGMDVINSIVNLPTTTVITGFGAPVQNYNSDPDNNPATPPPAPTADQLIRITHAEIIPPTAGNASGITFSIAHIYNAGTTTASDLVSGKVTGTSLALKYKTGAAGAVDVVVQADAGGGNITTDTFRVTVDPNLITRLTGDGLPSFIVPGDSSTVKIQIANTGGAVAKGKIDVHFYLAEEMLDPSTNTYVLVDPLVKTSIGDVLGLNVSVASGGTLNVAGQVQIPKQLVADQTIVYRMYAEVAPSGALATQELFTDDNATLSGANHEVFNQFGNVNSRLNVPMTFVDTDGDMVTFKMTGSGTGQLTHDASGGVDLLVGNTNATSKLTAQIVKSATGDGRVLLNDININTLVGSVSLGSFDVNGFIAASGGIQTLTLGNLAGPATIEIGAALPDNAKKATIKLGNVDGYSLDSAMPITSITANEWLASDGGTYAINALSLNKLSITGAKGIRGDLDASVNIQTAASTSAVSVAGFFNNSAITTVGNLGAIKLGGIAHSSVFAGVTSRPAALTDFTGLQSITSFTIAGIAGYSGDLFIESQVAAQQLGTVSVKNVSGDGAGDFGFVADIIKSYNRVGGVKLSNLKDPLKLTPNGQADKVGAHYLAEIL